MPIPEMTLRRPAKFLFVALVAWLLTSVATTGFAQCENSISIKKKDFVSASSRTGVLEIEVSTISQFICTLSIEEGSGPKKIQEQKGQGSTVISFNSLDENHVYKVQVEFLGEAKELCRKLEKSGLILEAQ